MKYLKDVKEGKLPPNNKIIFLLQVLYDAISVNNKLAAKPKLLGLNKGLLGQEQ